MLKLRFNGKEYILGDLSPAQHRVLPRIFEGPGMYQFATVLCEAAELLNKVAPIIEPIDIKDDTIPNEESVY